MYLNVATGEVKENKPSQIKLPADKVLFFLPTVDIILA